MVLNLDVAPTLLDFAGIKAPSAMQGRSAVPLLAERTDVAWRQAFFYEYFLEPGYPQTPTVLAVRTTTAKLIRYPGHEDWTEVFDLKADPYEMQNLARKPEHADLRARLEAEFVRQRDAVGFEMKR
jgi:arylsulfatase A-like enzyme